MCGTKARLDGKVAVVTGGSSGIGYEAAKNLAQKGARVVIASRNKTKLINARDRIIQETGNSDIAYRLLDLGSLQSVRDFTQETILQEARLDILVNNAGAVGLPDRLTQDGLSLQMQVNYFGVFLLTYLLVPLLRASSPSRVITGTAASMYVGEIDFDHWNDIGRYNAVTSLANSKLADTLFTAELDRRLSNTEVTANTFDPFLVRNTDIFDNSPDVVKDVGKLFVNMIGRPKEEVGEEIAYLAAEPSLADVSGVNYKFCRKWIGHWLAYDDTLTRKLWDISKKLVRISDEEDWETI